MIRMGSQPTPLVLKRDTRLTLDFTRPRIQKNDQCSSFWGFWVIALPFDQEFSLLGGCRTEVVQYSWVRVSILVGEEIPILLDSFDQVIDALGHFIKTPGRGF